MTFQLPSVSNQRSKAPASASKRTFQIEIFPNCRAAAPVTASLRLASHIKGTNPRSKKSIRVDALLSAPLVANVVRRYALERQRRQLPGRIRWSRCPRQPVWRMMTRSIKTKTRTRGCRPVDSPRQTAASSGSEWQTTLPSSSWLAGGLVRNLGELQRQRRLDQTNGGAISFEEPFHGARAGSAQSQPPAG